MPEQIYSVMQSNQKKNIKMLADYWWRELNAFYKDALENAVKSRDIQKIAETGKRINGCYAEYKMYCEYINEKPNPEPEFIRRAREAYVEIKSSQGKQVMAGV